jgi:hypothetical protein
LQEYEKDAQVCTSSPLLTNVAGDESSGGNTLLADFILFAQKLEERGFTYYKDRVTVIDP